MKKFPAEKRAKIAAALRLNWNAAAVAKQIGGVSPETVRAVAKEARIKLAEANPAKRKRLSPEQRAQIIEALRANPNGNLVARQFSGVISARTVQKIAEKAGVQLSTTGERHWRAMAAGLPERAKAALGSESL